jgi:hypothetical protein
MRDACYICALAVISLLVLAIMALGARRLKLAQPPDATLARPSAQIPNLRPV